MLEIVHAFFDGAVAIGALTGAVVSVLSLRQNRQNAVALGENKSAMIEQHAATNSRLTELLRTSKEAADAIGHARGVAEERARGANPT